MTSVSPWVGDARVESPDGRFHAVIESALEICMGGPTMGTLAVVDVARSAVVCQLEACSPSLVWAEDSGRIALPVWVEGRAQRLAIVAVPGGGVRVMDTPFRVLELESFTDGVVRGIDSPIHEPKTVAVTVEDL